MNSVKRATVADANSLYKQAGYSGRATPTDLLYGAYRGHQCVSVTRLQDYSDQWLLRNLCTLPSERRQGLARTLCRSILIDVEKTVWLFPLPGLHALYEQAGFRAVPDNQVPEALQKVWLATKKKYPQSQAMVAEPTGDK